MGQLLKLKIALSSFALFSIAAYAQTDKLYTIEGTVPTIIETQTDPYAYGKETLSAEELSGTKLIRLLKIRPSQELIQKHAEILAEMENAAGEKDYTGGVTPFVESRGAVDLTMNSVPVLDQGSHGTCVTFASTAALDALIKKGDFVDQQCSLALNKGLGNDYWDGAYKAGDVLDPLKKYGVYKKNDCFGVKYANPSQSLTAEKYQTKSDKSYENLINITYVSGAHLDQVKEALKAGHRVALGTFLANSGDSISIQGFNMKIGSKTTKGGLWACKQPGNSTNYCSEQNAGHEVVIFGYDDNQQLLKIRNSWTASVGDSGDFYMTYDFYNAMAIDFTIIK